MWSWKAIQSHEFDVVKLIFSQNINKFVDYRQNISELAGMIEHTRLGELETLSM